MTGWRQRDEGGEGGEWRPRGSGASATECTTALYDSRHSVLAADNLDRGVHGVSWTGEGRRGRTADESNSSRVPAEPSGERRTREGRAGVTGSPVGSDSEVSGRSVCVLVCRSVTLDARGRERGGERATLPRSGPMTRRGGAAAWRVKRANLASSGCWVACCTTSQLPVNRCRVPPTL